MTKPLKKPSPYALASVDNALRIAAMLQLEGSLTVKQVAERLGVANSTAHRLLATLVYRDFAAQDPDRSYRVGSVLELAAHSQTTASRLRARSLPHLRRLVDLLDESANLTVRTGDTVRFIASVESSRTLRVGSREGMAFPAHRTTAGLLLLAQLTSDELEELYAEDRYVTRMEDRPNMVNLRSDIDAARRNGYAFNQERSERGVVAVGVPVHGPDGDLLAGISISMPSVRYSIDRLPILIASLRSVAARLEQDLDASGPKAGRLGTAT